MSVDLIAGTAPEPFSTSKTSNWVARVGGLPTLFQHVAHDLMESGGKLTESQAIEEAIGIVHNWAHGHDGKGNRVSPAVVAEAVKAIAEWDSKRARAHAMARTASERVAVELAFATPKRGGKIRQAIRSAIFGNPRESTVPGNGNHAGVKPKVVEMAGRRFLVSELAGPSAAERKAAAKRGAAMPGGRFPIRNHDELKKAVQAVGRARPNTGPEHAKVRRFVMKRAKAIGGSHLIPSNWAADGSLNS